MIGARAIVTLMACAISMLTVVTVARAAPHEVRVAAEITLPEVWPGEYATVVWDSVGAENCDLILPPGFDPPVGIEYKTNARAGAMQVGPFMDDATPAVECDGVRIETPVKAVPLEREKQDGVFDIDCHFSHAADDDPIMFPGQPGASHNHSFLGNKFTDAYSTPVTLLQALIDDPNATTCSEDQHFRDQHRPARNASAYWVMTMYVDGRVFPLLSFHTYYFNMDNGIVRPFPPGFRMITDHRLMKFKYWCVAPGQFAKDRLPRACQGNRTFHLEIRFPNCWDGRLDSPDHMSHMAFGENGCPMTHRHRLPRLLMELKFGGPKEKIDVDADWRLSGGPLGEAHADYMNAWDQFRLDELIHLCSNKEARCKGFPPPGSFGPVRQVKA